MPLDPHTESDIDLDLYAENQDRSDRVWPEPDLSILDDRRGTLPEFPVDAVPALAD